MSIKSPTITSPRWIKIVGESSLAYKLAMANTPVSIVERMVKGKKTYNIIFDNSRCQAIRPFGHESNAIRYMWGWNKLAEVRKAQSCKI